MYVIFRFYAKLAELRQRIRANSMPVLNKDLDSLPDASKANLENLTKTYGIYCLAEAFSTIPSGYIAGIVYNLSGTHVTNFYIGSNTLCAHIQLISVEI